MVRLRAIGESIIEIGEHRLTPESEVLFGVMLYFACHAGRVIARQTLVEMFWPEEGERRARHCLRQAVYRLRQLGARIERREDGLVISAREVSQTAFRDRRDARAEDRHSQEAAFLPGYSQAFSPAFSRWIEDERARMHAALRTDLLAELARARGSCKINEIEELAYRCLALDPLNEEATLAIAEAAALSGNKLRALNVIDSYSHEIGNRGKGLHLPAAMLRQRISEADPDHSSSSDEPVLVGRTEILASITSHLKNARLGGVRAYVLVGEAGIGKSRILRHLARVATLSGASQLFLKCQPTDQQRPLSLFLSSIPKLLNQNGALGCEPGHFEMLNLFRQRATVDESEDAARAAAFRSASIRLALKDLVSAVRSENELCVLIDDAQWLDDASVQLIAEILVTDSSDPLTVVLACRSHKKTRITLSCIPDVQEILVPPLDSSESLQVLSSVSWQSGIELTPEAMAWTIRTANGNPFYLIELAKHAATGGRGSEPSVSLRRLLRARLKRLPEPSLRTIQACAVLGKHATLTRLEALLELPAHELVGWLKEVEDAGLLTSSGSSLSIGHDLIAAEALAQLSPSGLSFLHLRAGRLLESEASVSPSSDLVWNCATHYQIAGEPTSAIRTARVCAQHLLTVGQPIEAAGLLERVLPFSGAREEQAELLGDLAQARRCLGEWTEVLRLLDLRRALRPVGTLGHGHDDAIIRLEVLWRRDADTTILPSVIARADATEASHSHRLRAVVLAMAIADNACEAALANRLIQVASTLSARDSIDAESLAKAQLIYHSSFGSLDQAILCGENLAQTARRSRDDAKLSQALRWSSVPLLRLGRFDAGIAAIVESRDIAERLGITSEAVYCALALSDIAFEMADASLCASTVNDLVRLSQPFFDPSLLAGIHTIRARQHLECADYDEAASQLAAAEALMPRVRFVRGESQRLAIKARLLLHNDEIQALCGVTARLRFLHARLREVGTQDFAVHALFCGLSRLDELSAARAILLDYVRRCRRERFRLPRCLAELVGEGSRDTAVVSPGHRSAASATAKTIVVTKP